MRNRIPPRPEYYFYVHNMLKKFMIDNLRHQFFVSSESHRNTVVNLMWNRLNGRDSTHESYFDDEHWFPSRTILLGENRYLFVVVPPEPMATTEAYFVGIYADFNTADDAPEQDPFLQRATHMRYFTLEYHDERRCCFCEWESENHILIGFKEDKSIEFFIDRIREIVG